MANLGENDPAATEPINSELPNPSGQVHVHPNHPNHDVLVGQMKTHLAEISGHAKATADYHRGMPPQAGATGVTGQSSQGAMSPGGASGASYETTSTGNTGDCDSGGPGPD